MRKSKNALITTLRTVILPLSLMAFIGVLSSVPGTGDSPGATLLGWVPPNVQNLLHLPLFALLAWSWCRALGRLGWAPAGAWASAALISFAWAVLDELHQLYVPGRYASMTDMALNVAGIATGLVIYARVRAFR